MSPYKSTGRRPASPTARTRSRRWRATPPATPLDSVTNTSNVDTAGPDVASRAPAAGTTVEGDDGAERRRLGRQRRGAGAVHGRRRGHRRGRHDRAVLVSWLSIDVPNGDAHAERGRARRGRQQDHLGPRDGDRLQPGGPPATAAARRRRSSRRRERPAGATTAAGRWGHHDGEPRSRADPPEAVAREVPQGQDDDDQLPPQRGGEGGAVVRAQAARAAGPRPLRQARQAAAAELHALRAHAQGAEPPGQGGHEQVHLPRQASRTHALAAGSYRITLRATDSTGKRSAPIAGELQADESASKARRGPRGGRARLALGCRARKRSPTAGTSTPRCSRASASGCSRTPGSTPGTAGSSPSRARTSRCGSATCRWWSCATARASCARS